jgi:hypothetical protein
MSTATQPAPPKTAARGWFARNWKWFVPSAFLLVVVLAGIAAFGYVTVRLHRYRSHPVYELALSTVQESSSVKARLGEPIRQSGLLPERKFDLEGEIIHGLTLNFTVTGPKETAAVAAQANLLDGEWAVNGLRVRFPDGEQVNLTQDVLAKQKIDTPEFDLASEQKGKSTTDQPTQESPELNVQVPDLPPELK